MIHAAITETKFYNQYDNGENLDENLSVFTDHLAGNVTDRMKAKFRFEFAVLSEKSSPTNTFKVEQSIFGKRIVRQSGSWIDDGFELFDVVTLISEQGGVKVLRGKITQITDTIINFSAITFSAGTYTDATLYLRSTLTAMRFKHNLIENNEGTNFVSKIDGTKENLFAGINIGALQIAQQYDNRNTQWQDLSATTQNFSIQSNLERGDFARARWVETYDETGYFAQVFEVEHTFMILRYYLEGQLSNFQNQTFPPLFTGSNSLKYVFEINLRDGFTGVNVQSGKKLTYDNVAGNVGWFDEGLNGGIDNYTIQNLVYTDVDNNNIITEIAPQVKTRVNFEIKNAAGVISGANRVSVGFSLLPSASEYQQKSTNINQNFLLDTAIADVDVLGVSSEIIKDYTATFVDANTINVQFDLVFDPVIAATLQDKCYVVFATTENPLLDPIATDRVTNFVDSNCVIFNADIPDLVFIDELNHYPHNLDNTGLDHFDNYAGWIEDGFSLKFPMWINTDKFAEIKTLKVHLSAYSPFNGNIFNLQTYNFNLSDGVAISSGGNNAVAHNVNTTRNYNLKQDSQFKAAKVSSSAASFTTKNGFNAFKYNIELGYKANFEEWIAQADADAVFFDPNEPENGLNKKASRYSENQTYDIRVIIECDMFHAPTGSITKYKFISRRHRYFDYDLDDNVTPAYTAQIQTFDNVGNDTNGVINGSDFTNIKATFTPVSGTTDFISPYAIIRIVPRQGTVFTQHELSSIRESEFNNILVPLVGESFTKLTDNGTNYVAECRIDGTLLEQGLNYDISATLRDGEHEILLITENDIEINTEDALPMEKE